VTVHVLSCGCAAAAGRRNGSYPYGFRELGYRRCAPDAAEQEVIARIRELWAAGESLRSIAAALDAEGRRPRRAERWSAPVVRNILMRGGCGAPGCVG
jgi:hypothetical protein